MPLAKKTFARWSKLLVGSLLVGCVLLLNTLAASPNLHKLFHTDAGQAEHQCAVTLFAHGKVEGATVEASVPATLTLIEGLPSVDFSVFCPAIENLPAGRAPPVSFFNS